jgi:hypothetical protein
MKKCLFIDDIFFPNGIFKISESYLKSIQTLSNENELIYFKFKEYSNKKIYGPLKISENIEQGYIVQATSRIEKYTLICEYSGPILHFEPELMKEDDSLMEYATYDETKLVISPIYGGYCNIARFISGINNIKTGNKANVASIKFRIWDSIHILLYTIKTIKPAETLYYNYRSGNIKEYPTHNFK